MAETNLNLNFKRGTQASLDLLTTSNEGTFYLTNDTNRLYIGTGAAPALLNQTVQIVASFDNLPTSPAKNDFYYLTKENVLAVYTGSAWQQINKDTNTDTKVSGISFTKNNQSSDNSLIYDVNISLKDINGGDAGNITTTFTVNSADISSLVPEAATVGLAVENSTNKAIIKTEGEGSDSSNNISITGTGLAKVSASGDNITINVEAPAINHTLGAKNTAVVLTNPSGGETSVSFTAGTGIEVTNDNGAIAYSHKEYTATDRVQANKYVSGISIENGHITGVSHADLPIDKNTTNDSFELASTLLSLKDTDGKSVSVDLVTLVDEAKNYTDNKLKALESVLDYKGSATVTTKPQTTPQKGDTYLVGIDGAFGIAGAKVGDLIVYNGSSWDIIPSGDELNIDTTYTANFESKTFSIKDSNGATIGSLKVDNVTNNPIIVNGNSTDKKNGTITVEHNTVKSDGTEIEDSSTETGNYEYRAITGINVDKYGHVSGYQTSGFNSKTYTLTAANNVITLGENSGAKNQISVEDDDIVIAAANTNKLSLSHKTYTLTKVTNNGGALAHGTSVPIITYEFDGYGHVTKQTTTNYTLPSETTYGFEYGNNSVTLKTNSGANKGSISINGSGNVAVASTNGAFGIGLVWGTF